MQQVDGVAGPDGIEALIAEARGAYGMSGELQDLARTNSPTTAGTDARAARRQRLLLAFLALGALVAWAGAAASLTGYITAPRVASAIAFAIGAGAVAAYFVVAARARRKNAWY